MAYVIPMRSTGERGPQVLIIILTKENLERMKEADPFDLQPRAYSKILNVHQAISRLDIVIAYEEDEAALVDLARAGDPEAIIAYLERGRVQRPGDAIPPVSIKGKAQ